MKQLPILPKKYELRSFLNKLTYRREVENVDISYEEITSCTGLALNSIKEFSFFLDGEMSNYYNANPSFLYFKLNDLVYRIAFTDLIKDEPLKEIFSSERIIKISYDIKRAFIILMNNGLVVARRL